MKVIIAGSREGVTYDDIEKGVGQFQQAWGLITEVVSGCAAGTDSLGEKYAGFHNIPIKQFPAKWNKYGRAAGPIRNKEMAEYADGLIAISVNDSRGTANMIQNAKRLNLKTNVITKKLKDRTQKQVDELVALVEGKRLGND
jgi:hypothetical protein